MLSNSSNTLLFIESRYVHAWVVVWACVHACERVVLVDNKQKYTVVLTNLTGMLLSSTRSYIMLCVCICCFGVCLLFKLNGSKNNKNITHKKISIYICLVIIT